MKRILTTSLLVLAAASSLLAQESVGNGGSPSTIVVTGNAFESVSPDGVVVELLVWSLEQKPDDASTETAVIADNVVSALQTLGISDLQISRVGFRVGPHWDYNVDGERKFDGYSASVTIRAETGALEQTGRIVDAGLSAGIRELRSIRYLSSEMAQIRRQALSAAVQAARQDAEAIAEAAGGRLGRLLKFTTGSTGRLPLSNSRGFGGDASTLLTPENLTVNVGVESHWQFLAGAELD